MWNFFFKSSVQKRKTLMNQISSKLKASILWRYCFKESKKKVADRDRISAKHRNNKWLVPRLYKELIKLNKKAHFFLKAKELKTFYQRSYTMANKQVDSSTASWAITEMEIKVTTTATKRAWQLLILPSYRND